MSEFKKRIFSSIILVLLSFFFIIKGKILFLSFLILCFLISCYEWNKIAQSKITLISGLIFLSISFFCAFEIREDSKDIGLNVFLFLVIISVSTDVGGYTFGKILKGPKLIKISPNKTYSGVLGSFIFAILSIILFVNYVDYGVDKITINEDLIFLVFFLSLISQAGDLIISYFKRISKLDNTGNLIPGHGGMLDRIDGMIFVFPSFYLLNIIYKII